MQRAMYSYTKQRNQKPKQKSIHNCKQSMNILCTRFIHARRLVQSEFIAISENSSFSGSVMYIVTIHSSFGEEGIFKRWNRLQQSREIHIVFYRLFNHWILLKFHVEITTKMVSCSEDHLRLHSTYSLCWISLIYIPVPLKSHKFDTIDYAWGFLLPDGYILFSVTPSFVVSVCCRSW